MHPGTGEMYAESANVIYSQVPVIDHDDTSAQLPHKFGLPSVRKGRTARHIPSSDRTYPAFDVLGGDKDLPTPLPLCQ